MQARLVHWAPWSVLKIAGRPRLRALARASIHKAPSRVSETAHDHTDRLHPAITATTEIQPGCKRLEVLAALHPWLPRSIFTPRQRDGYIVCPARGWLSCGLV